MRNRTERMQQWIDLVPTATPFDMPSYVQRERAEADRWEQVAADASDAALHAGETSDR